MENFLTDVRCRLFRRKTSCLVSAADSFRTIKKTTVDLPCREKFRVDSDFEVLCCMIDVLWWRQKTNLNCSKEILISYRNKYK